MIINRIPPQDIDSEKAVIGCLCSLRDSFYKLSHLREEMFYRDSHRAIWRACWDLFKSGMPIDLLTVSNKLKTTGCDELEGTTAIGYIADLIAQVASSANVERYSFYIIDKWMLRESITFCDRNIPIAYDPETNPHKVAEDGIKFFSDLLNPISSKNTQAIEDIVLDSISSSETAKRVRKEGGTTGTPTGFNSIDSMNGGFTKGDLVIIAARPSMGKTAFVTQIAMNASERKIPVGFFSLEMSKAQIGNRIMSIKTGFDGLKIKNGYMDSDEFAYLREMYQGMKGCPLFIDDTPALSIVELRARSFHMKGKHNVGLICVDYLQLMHGTRNKGASRDEEIGTITKGLKAIAKELEIPVIALSQLSRAVETRGGDKKPMLSDLRESGNIEQDADVVMFLYRPEYYGIQIDELGNSTSGLCYVNTAKYRNGQIGESKLKFIPQNTKFVDWDESLLLESQNTPLQLPYANG